MPLRRYLRSVASARLGRRVGRLGLQVLAVTLSWMMVFPIGAAQAASPNVNCVNKLLKNQMELAEVWRDETCTCIANEDAFPGLYNAETCLDSAATGGNANINSAEQRLRDLDADGAESECGTAVEALGYIGYVGAEVMIDASRKQAVNLTHQIFGEPLLQGIPANGDSAIASCRQSLCTGAHNLGITHMKKWRSCVKGAIASGSALSDDDILTSCLAKAGLSKKVRGAENKLLKKLSKQGCAVGETGFLVAHGQGRPTAVEYAVMLALIIVICIAAIALLGSHAESTFKNISELITGNPDQFDDKGMNGSHLINVSADLAFAHSGARSRFCKNMTVDGSPTLSFNCFDLDTNSYNARGVAIGHLTTDSLTDLIVAADSPGTMNGPTRTCAQQGYGFACNEVGYFDSVSLGDLDRDGDLDAVYGKDSGSGNSLTRCLNYSNATMPIFSCNEIEAGLDTRGTAIGDLTGDSHADIIAAHNATPARLCRRNIPGPQTYICSDLANTTGAIDSAIADTEGDGDADAVFATGHNGIVCRNNGTGTLTCADVIPGGTVTDISAVAVGNLDGDRAVEIVLAASWGGPSLYCDSDNGVEYTCSGLDGSLTIVATDVAIADLNSDGARDLVFARSGTSSTVCRNSGAGIFTCSAVDTGRDTALAVAVGAGIPDGTVP